MTLALPYLRRPFEPCGAVVVKLRAVARKIKISAAAAIK
jgi:hypothetical protein